MASAAERLTELADELEGTSYEPWTKVELWIAKTRPLMAHAFPAFLGEFSGFCKSPPFQGGPRMYTVRSQFDGPYEEAQHAQNERMNQQQDADERRSYNERLQTAHGKLLAFVRGVVTVSSLPPAEVRHNPSSVVHHAPVTHITNSNVGSAAIGAGSRAEGHVVVSPTTPVSKEMLKEAVSELQTILVSLQDRLEQVDDRVYDFVSQLLVNVRKIQLEQADLTTALAKINDVNDDAWAKEAAAAAKPKLLPKVKEGAKLIGEVAKNPLAQQIVKKLIES